MEFMEFLEKTLREEGGWSDHAADPGGKTMMGITQGTLSAWLGRKATDDEIRNLSRDEAINIYRNMYYLQPKINLLPDEIEHVVFDWAVNAGPGRAIMGLQTLCNKAGVISIPLHVDGGIGPKTVNAVQETLNAMGLKNFVNAYQDERQEFYNEIIRRKPSQAVFEAGWRNRVNRFRMA